MTAANSGGSAPRDCSNPIILCTADSCHSNIDSVSIECKALVKRSLYTSTAVPMFAANKREVAPPPPHT